MIVQLKNKLKKVNINYDYLLGDWVKLFSSEFLNSFYMKNLMSFLFIKYKENPDIIRPVQKEVFNAFTECKYKNLKIVLVTEYLSTSFKNNGNGLGNNNFVNTEYQMTDEMKQLKRCVENVCYNGVRIQFDNTLSEWSDQGILCLNTALTCTNTDNKAHVKYWEVFIKEVLSNINKKNSNIIFAFIGDACKYSKYVDDKYNHIIEEKESIDFCNNNGKIWISDIFTKIDDLLYEISNSRHDYISW